MQKGLTKKGLTEKDIRFNYEDPYLTIDDENELYSDMAKSEGELIERLKKIKEDKKGKSFLPPRSFEEDLASSNLYKDIHMDYEVKPLRFRDTDHETDDNLEHIQQKGYTNPDSLSPKERQQFERLKAREEKNYKAAIDKINSSNMTQQEKEDEIAMETKTRPKYLYEKSTFTQREGIKNERREEDYEGYEGYLDNSEHWKVYDGKGTKKHRRRRRKTKCNRKKTNLRKTNLKRRRKHRTRFKKGR